MKAAWWSIIIGVILFSAPVNAATFLSFDSQPGDYIGQGIEQTWTTEDGTFTANGTTASNVVQISFSGGTAWWYLDFAAPQGQTLQPGPYENATRYPFQSPTLPGLSVSGCGRGCNTLTGRFDVLEVSYSATGQIERFSADFEQHCEGGTPALFGSIRYNASVGFPLKVNIRANSKDTPISVKVGEPVEISTATDAGDDAGIAAEYWLGKSGPYGTQWLSNGRWSKATTSPKKWFSGPVSTSSASFTWTPDAPGVYLFQFAIDYTLDNRLSTQFVDHAVVTVLE